MTGFAGDRVAGPSAEDESGVMMKKRSGMSSRETKQKTVELGWLGCAQEQHWATAGSAVSNHPSLLLLPPDHHNNNTLAHSLARRHC